MGRDYRVHLDGYNILPMLTGETDESPRHEIFYFTDDGDLPRCATTTGRSRSWSRRRGARFGPGWSR